MFVCLVCWLAPAFKAMTNHVRSKLSSKWRDAHGELDFYTECRDPVRPEFVRQKLLMTIEPLLKTRPGQQLQVPLQALNVWRSPV